MVTPYRFTAPLSPERAAALEGRSLTLPMLAHACEPHSEESIVLVEGAGGFFSPIATEALNADLAKQLQFPVILVAEQRLGAVNQILLSYRAILSYGLPVVLVVLNRYDRVADAEMMNLQVISDQVAAPVISVDQQSPCDSDTPPWQAIASSSGAALTEPLISQMEMG